MSREIYEFVIDRNCGCAECGKSLKDDCIVKHIQIENKKLIGVVGYCSECDQRLVIKRLFEKVFRQQGQDAAFEYLKRIEKENEKI